MDFLSNIFRIIGNKYFLTILAFAAWMLFFDNNNLLRQRQMAEQLNELEREKSFYLEQIERNSNIAEALENDTALLEKYAREKYLMKRDNEDIYLIVYEEEVPNN
jgi:cell division protein FtsB